MSKANRVEMWQRENAVADDIPYTAHLDRHTIKTRNGDYLQIIRLDGMAHESADDQDIEIRKDQLNLLYRNIASPQLAIWSHVIRREQNAYPGGSFPPGFAMSLNEKYQKHLSDNTMMVNELFLTILYRPIKEKGSRAFSKKSREEKREILLDHLDFINDITSTVLASLGAYTPHLLETYEEKGILYSEALELLGMLVNGEWQRFPVTRNPIADVLATSRPFFGHETIEIRTPVDRIYGATLTIKEYPEATAPGMFNALLSAPYPLILSQSFVFKSRPVALELMKRQQDRMINAGDLAESQINAITDALDDITSGRFVMGDHHQSLTVFADTRKQLKLNVSGARNALADCGLVVAREDLALEAAWWAQLPGNFKYRPRPAPITSKNLAGMASLHNYPSGRLEHNQWGPAVTLLKTSSGTPYYFNFHEVLDEAREIKKGEKGPKKQQRTLGNTAIIGPSGSGKTVVQAFMLSQAQKYKPTCVMFDKDRGLEIFVRAMGGTYLPLKKGETTGLNPFGRLQPTPHNIHFLETLVKKLVTHGGHPLKVTEEQEISNAVKGVMGGLKQSSRRLSAVLAYMDKTDPEGAGARLRRWCEVTDTGSPGPLAWVFDNENDVLDMSEKRLFGFDVTEFLDHPEIRTPIVMYLFHRMEELIDGRRFMAFLDEFWKLLMDEYFEDFANNKLKTIRKQNGFLVLGTQSPRDVLNSKIAHSIIEQCATNIYMPNPKANEEDYIKGFKLSGREYQIVREEMPEGSRSFLVKQGNSSVVAELDLKGFSDELAVLSGSTDTILLAEQVINEVGEDPAIWLPIFQKMRKA